MVLVNLHNQPFSSRLGTLVRLADCMGEAVPRSLVVMVCVQLRHQQPGAAGGRGLHDHLPEWSHSPPQDARDQLVQEVLPDD